MVAAHARGASVSAHVTTLNENLYLFYRLRSKPRSACRLVTSRFRRSVVVTIKLFFYNTLSEILCHVCVLCRNGESYGHSCCGMQIRKPYPSCRMLPFPMTLSDPYISTNTVARPLCNILAMWIVSYVLSLFVCAIFCLILAIAGDVVFLVVCVRHVVCGRSQLSLKTRNLHNRRECNCRECEQCLLGASTQA